MKRLLTLLLAFLMATSFVGCMADQTINSNIESSFPSSSDNISSDYDSDEEESKEESSKEESKEESSSSSKKPSSEKSSSKKPSSKKPSSSSISSAESSSKLVSSDSSVITSTSSKPSSEVGSSSLSKPSSSTLSSSSNPTQTTKPTESSKPLVSSQKPSSSKNPSTSSGSSSSNGSSDKNSSTLPPSQSETVPPNHSGASNHEDHYFYSALTDRQKEYYEVLYTAINKLQSEWIVLGTADENYKVDVAVAREAVLLDHPEIFWVPNYYLVGLSSAENGERSAIMLFTNDKDDKLSYLVSKTEKEAMEKRLDEEVSKIIGRVTATTAYEIELQIHNILCDKIVYTDNATDDMIYTAYGAIVNGKALCEGYSRAMQLLLSKFGITAISVVGEAAGEGHMWNQVRLDGEWYNLDVTWNDKEELGITYEYFNVPDFQIEFDHIFSKDYTALTEKDVNGTIVAFNINRPACVATKYNYFEKSGFVLTKTNMDELIEYLVSASDKDTVEVGVSMAVCDEIRALGQKYLNDLNTQLAVKHPTCGFKVSQISISNFCIQFHKANKTARR